MQQPGLEAVPMWDVGVMGGNLAYCATMPTLVITIAGDCSQLCFSSAETTCWCFCVLILKTLQSPQVMNVFCFLKYVVLGFFCLVCFDFDLILFVV